MIKTNIRKQNRRIKLKTKKIIKNNIRIENRRIKMETKNRRTKERKNGIQLKTKTK
jgi:hypothetical protein